MRNLITAINKKFGTEVPALLGFLALAMVVFSLTATRFLSSANFGSMAFQSPELGLLTLAMLVPIISGGFNLAIIYTANISGPTLAWVLIQYGGVDASPWAIALGVVLALAVGAISGAIMGFVIAYIGAHAILVSLAMMIFLRGLGEFLTRGGDISGFPDYLAVMGHASFFGIPVPLLLFLVAALVWHIMLTRTRHGFAVYMIGSNIRASDYAGLHTKRALTLIYTFSGMICAVAGILMLTRFNSVRVGHGEALMLITVLACFLGGVDPFGGFGIEPVNRSENHLINTGWQAKAMIETVGADNILIHLDTYHMNIEEKGAGKGILDAREHLRYIHLSESDRGTPGMCTCGWNEIYATLAAIGFKGGLAMESFINMPPEVGYGLAVWRPVATDFAEVMDKGLPFLRNMAAQYRLI